MTMCLRKAYVLDIHGFFRKMKTVNSVRFRVEDMATTAIIVGITKKTFTISYSVTETVYASSLSEIELRN